MPVFQGNRGFSLIEMLIAISIVSLVGVFSIPQLKQFNKDQSFENIASDFKNSLRLAQSKAISSIKCTNKPSSKWIVKVQPSSYQIIPYCENGDNTQSPDVLSAQTTVTLPGGVIFTSTGCPQVTDTDLIFDKRSFYIICSAGDPILYSTVITLQDSQNNTKSINISPGGVVGD